MIPSSDKLLILQDKVSTLNPTTPRRREADGRTRRTTGVVAEMSVVDDATVFANADASLFNFRLILGLPMYQ
jgi:hypothetical protein